MKVTADLFPRGTVISGLRGSGKTNLARYVAGLDGAHVLVYDPLHEGEWSGFDRLVPKRHNYPESADEFASLVELAELHDTQKHDYRLLIIDEAQLIAPNQQRLHPAIRRMNTVHRHWPLGVVWIAQRPRFLHYDIVNLADHLFLFSLPGATDMRYLDDLARGLSEANTGLEDYHFNYVDRRRRYWTFPPVPEMGS